MVCDGPPERESAAKTTTDVSPQSLQATVLSWLESWASLHKDSSDISNSIAHATLACFCPTNPIAHQPGASAGTVDRLEYCRQLTEPAVSTSPINPSAESLAELFATLADALGRCDYLSIACDIHCSNSIRSLEGMPGRLAEEARETITAGAERFQQEREAVVLAFQGSRRDIGCLMKSIGALREEEDVFDTGQ